MFFTCNFLQYTVIMLRCGIQNCASETKEEMGICVQSKPFARGKGEVFDNLIVQTQVDYGVEHTRK